MEKVVETVVELTELEKAKQVIESKNKEDIELCGKEIDEAIKAISEKYKCTMLIVGEFRGNQISTGIQIVKSE